jgi:hypothetical protein
LGDLVITLSCVHVDIRTAVNEVAMGKLEVFKDVKLLDSATNPVVSVFSETMKRLGEDRQQYLSLRIIGKDALVSAGSGRILDATGGPSHFGHGMFSVQMRSLANVNRN